MTVQRYEWEDALVDAQTTGLIPNGALLLALKLARAINWCPKDKRPAGLYWKNEDALESVGASRATYFKHRQSLVETGFFRQENGNLLPTMPDESLVETRKSLVKTTESLVETEKSLVDNPLSVDTFSEDELSEETLSEEGPVSASASPTLPNAFSPDIREVVTSDLLMLEVEESGKSLVETGHTKRFLSAPEKKSFEGAARIAKATPEQTAQALEQLQTTRWTGDIYEAATEALRASGAVSAEGDAW